MPFTIASDELKRRFSERLYTYRKEKGLTQDQLAVKLGVTRMTYSYYESAKRTPDIGFLSNMHDLSGYTMEYLLGKSEFRTVHEESEALQLILDCFEPDMEVGQAAIKIYVTVKNLLYKCADEGCEGIFQDFLHPLQKLCTAIDAVIKEFHYKYDDTGVDYTKEGTVEGMANPRPWVFGAISACNELILRGFSLNGSETRE